MPCVHGLPEVLLQRCSGSQAIVLSCKSSHGKGIPFPWLFSVFIQSSTLHLIYYSASALSGCICSAVLHLLCRSATDLLLCCTAVLHLPAGPHLICAGAYSYGRRDRSRAIPSPVATMRPSESVKPFHLAVTVEKVRHPRVILRHRGMLMALIPDPCAVGHIVPADFCSKRSAESRFAMPVMAVGPPGPQRKRSFWVFRSKLERAFEKQALPKIFLPPNT